MGLAGSTSKQQEPSEPEETTVFEDRISNLPEPLLCYILSFLTTKEAFATSILSSRWKTLWTLVPILDLDDSDIELTLPYSSIGSWISRSENHHKYRHRVSFADIVSRLWVLRNANPFPLQKIRIHWHCHRDSIDVDTWVHTAISRGFLQELDLEVSLHQPLNLTSTLFNYAKPLVVLKLGGSIVINPPSSSSSSSSSSSLGFPTLKVLHLHSVDYANHDSFWRFLTCCPVLQDLSVKSFSGNCPCNFKIIVPTLKILHLHFLHLSYELEINTPALEHIHFKGQLSKDVLLTNLSNVVDAVVVESLYICLDLEEFGNRVGDFIRALSNVKSLHLDSFTTHCLYNASEFDPPMFHNLALLKFDGGTHCWHGLLPLLRQSPNLEAFLLQKIPADHEEKTSIFEWMVTSSHLKTISFKGFDGSMDELKFVRDVLKEASFLETMKLYSSCLNLEEKLHVLQKLLMFPRKSSTCQIAFI